MAENNIDIKIIIDGAQAAKTLDDQKKALKEVANAIKTVGSGTSDYKKLKQSQVELNQEMFKGAQTLKDKRTAFKGLMNELGGLKRGTEEFNRLTQAVGEAKDEMDVMRASVNLAADDFGNLRAGIEAGTLIASSFGLATGALSLFGIESEEAEETQKKLVAVLTVVNTLNVIGNLLRKESAFVQKLSNFQTRVSVGLLGQERIARISANVATGQATILQRALNAAMKVNPAMILVTAVLALTTAYTFFTSKTKDATKKQVDLNKEILEGTKIVEDYNKQVYDNTIKSEEDLIKAKKDNEKTRKELSLQRAKELEEQIQLVRSLANDEIDEISRLGLKKQEEINQDEEDTKVKLALAQRRLNAAQKDSEEYTALLIQTTKLGVILSEFDKQRTNAVETNAQEIVKINLKLDAELRKLNQSNQKKRLDELKDEHTRSTSIENTLRAEKVENFNDYQKSVLQEILKIEKERESILLNGSKKELKVLDEKFIEGLIKEQDYVDQRSNIMRIGGDKLLEIEKKRVAELDQLFAGNVILFRKANDILRTESALLDKRAAILAVNQIAQDLYNTSIGDSTFFLKENLNIQQKLSMQASHLSEIDRVAADERIARLKEAGVFENENNNRIADSLFWYTAHLKTAKEEERVIWQKNIDDIEEILIKRTSFEEKYAKERSQLVQKLTGEDLRKQREGLELQAQEFSFYAEKQKALLVDEYKTSLKLQEQFALQSLGVDEEFIDEFNRQKEAGHIQNLNQFVNFNELIEENLTQSTKNQIEIIKINKEGQQDVISDLINFEWTKRKENSEKINGLETQQKEHKTKLLDLQSAEIIEGIRITQEAQQIATNAASNNINKEYDLEIKRIDELEARKLEEFDMEDRLRKMREDNATVQDFQRMKREEIIAKKREEIEESATRERNKAALKQWGLQKKLRMGEIFMNAATAISLVTAQTGVAAPFSIPAIAAINAIQLGLVGSEQPPVFERGGRIGGNSHSNGGTMIEAEKDEVIINKKSSQMFPGLLSKINEIGGGVSFADTTAKEQSILSGVSGTAIDYDRLASLLNDRPIKTYVTESDMTNSQRTVRKQNRRAEF